DFIPLLGYLDDLILVPALIWLAVRLLPPHVVLQCRQRADAWLAERGKRPSSRVGIALIVVIWVAVAWLIWRWVAAH
ncbi:MAG: YkvA family protein, partial [Burkholderiaceae bacterium]